MFGSLLICILCFSFADIATAISLNQFMSRFPQQGNKKQKQDLSTEYPEPSSNSVRIYSLPFCPYGESVILAAYKKGIQFDIGYINHPYQMNWFLAKNPEGALPAVEHNGELVIDSLVIMEYLDDVFSENSILPDEPYLRAKQRYEAIKLDSICDAIRKVSYSKKLTGNITMLTMELTEAEQMLESPFYSGETFGLPDIVLYPCIQRLYMIGQTINDSFLHNYFPDHFPKLSEWFTRMQTLREIQAMQEIKQYLGNFVYGSGYYNA